MTRLKELKPIVKEILIAQNGKFYGYNVNCLYAQGFSGTDIQNAVNYFQFSPQQKSFREKYNVNRFND